MRQVQGIYDISMFIVSCGLFIATVCIQTHLLVEGIVDPMMIPVEQHEWQCD